MYLSYLLCIGQLSIIPTVIFTYNKIPILRPPLGLSKSGLKDHFWTVSMVVSNPCPTERRKALSLKTG